MSSAAISSHAGSISGLSSPSQNPTPRNRHFTPASSIDMATRVLSSTFSSKTSNANDADVDTTALGTTPATAAATATATNQGRRSRPPPPPSLFQTTADGKEWVAADRVERGGVVAAMALAADGESAAMVSRTKRSVLRTAAEKNNNTYETIRSVLGDGDGDGGGDLSQISSVEHLPPRASSMSASNFIHNNKIATVLPLRATPNGRTPKRKQKEEEAGGEGGCSPIGLGGAGPDASISAAGDDSSSMMMVRYVSSAATSQASPSTTTASLALDRSLSATVASWRNAARSRPISIVGVVTEKGPQHRNQERQAGGGRDEGSELGGGVGEHNEYDFENISTPVALGQHRCDLNTPPPPQSFFSNGDQIHQEAEVCCESPLSRGGRKFGAEGEARDEVERKESEAPLSHVGISVAENAAPLAPAMGTRREGSTVFVDLAHLSPLKNPRSSSAANANNLSTYLEFADQNSSGAFTDVGGGVAHILDPAGGSRSNSAHPQTAGDDSRLDAAATSGGIFAIPAEAVAFFDAEFDFDMLEFGAVDNIVGERSLRDLSLTKKGQRGGGSRGGGVAKKGKRAGSSAQKKTKGGGRGQQSTDTCCEEECEEEEDEEECEEAEGGATAGYRTQRAFSVASTAGGGGSLHSSLTSFAFCDEAVPQEGHHSPVGGVGITEKTRTGIADTRNAPTTTTTLTLRNEEEKASAGKAFLGPAHSDSVRTQIAPQADTNKNNNKDTTDLPPTFSGQLFTADGSSRVQQPPTTQLSAKKDSMTPNQKQQRGGTETEIKGQATDGSDTRATTTASAVSPLRSLKSPSPFGDSSNSKSVSSTAGPARICKEQQQCKDEKAILYGTDLKTEEQSKKRNTDITTVTYNKTNGKEEQLLDDESNFVQRETPSPPTQRGGKELESEAPLRRESPSKPLQKSKSTLSPSVSVSDLEALTINNSSPHLLVLPRNTYDIHVMQALGAGIGMGAGLGPFGGTPFVRGAGLFRFASLLGCAKRKAGGAGAGVGGSGTHTVDLSTLLGPSGRAFFFPNTNITMMAKASVNSSDGGAAPSNSAPSATSGGAGVTAFSGLQVASMLATLALQRRMAMAAAAAAGGTPSSASSPPNSGGGLTNPQITAASQYPFASAMGGLRNFNAFSAGSASDDGRRIDAHHQAILDELGQQRRRARGADGDLGEKEDEEELRRLSCLLSIKKRKKKKHSSAHRKSARKHRGREGDLAHLVAPGKGDASPLSLSRQPNTANAAGNNTDTEAASKDARIFTAGSADDKNSGKEAEDDDENDVSCDSATSCDESRSSSRTTQTNTNTCCTDTASIVTPSRAARTPNTLSFGGQADVGYVVVGRGAATPTPTTASQRSVKERNHRHRSEVSVFGHQHSHNGKLLPRRAFHPCGSNATLNASESAHSGTTSKTHVLLQGFDVVSLPSPTRSQLVANSIKAPSGLVLMNTASCANRVKTVLPTPSAVEGTQRGFEEDDGGGRDGANSAFSVVSLPFPPLHPFTTTNGQRGGKTIAGRQRFHPSGSSSVSPLPPPRGAADSPSGGSAGGGDHLGDSSTPSEAMSFDVVSTIGTARESLCDERHSNNNKNKKKSKYTPGNGASAPNLKTGRNTAVGGPLGPTTSSAPLNLSAASSSSSYSIIHVPTTASNKPHPRVKCAGDADGLLIPDAATAVFLSSEKSPVVPFDSADKHNMMSSKKLTSGGHQIANNNNNNNSSGCIDEDTVNNHARVEVVVVPPPPLLFAPSVGKNREKDQTPTHNNNTSTGGSASKKTLTRVASSDSWATFSSALVGAGGGVVGIARQSSTTSSCGARTPPANNLSNLAVADKNQGAPNANSTSSSSTSSHNSVAARKQQQKSAKHIHPENPTRPLVTAANVMAVAPPAPLRNPYQNIVKSAPPPHAVEKASATGVVPAASGKRFSEGAAAAAKESSPKNPTAAPKNKSYSSDNITLNNNSGAIDACKNNNTSSKGAFHIRGSQGTGGGAPCVGIGGNNARTNLPYTIPLSSSPSASAPRAFSQSQADHRIRNAVSVGPSKIGAGVGAGFGQRASATGIRLPGSVGTSTPAPRQPHNAGPRPLFNIPDSRGFSSLRDCSSSSASSVSSSTSDSEGY